MEYLGHLGRTLAFVMLALIVKNAAAQILLFETAGICNMTIRGVDIKGADIIAERATLIAFLTDYSSIYAHDCAWLLSPNPNNKTEAEYIVDNKAVASEFQDFAEDQVLIQLGSARQLLQIFAAGESAGQPPALPPVPPPPGQPSQNPIPELVLGQNECELDTEICLSSDGTITGAISCGAFTVGLSASGEISIGVEANDAESSITIR